MSPEYESSTARLFGKFLERGYVYKGLRPVYWCIHDQTALAEAEVEYREHTSPSVYVKFPLKTDPAEIDAALAGKNVFVVIWTTTPWTLPANLGITVHPDFDYSAIEVGRRGLHRRVRTGRGICRDVRFDEYEGTCSFQRLKARPARSKTRVARPHFADHERRPRHAWRGRRRGRARRAVREQGCRANPAPAAFTRLPATVRTTLRSAKSTGLRSTLRSTPPGNFTAEVEHFAGVSVFEANPKIVEFLRESGCSCSRENYEHRYPHCWRCKNPGDFPCDTAVVHLDG